MTDSTGNNTPDKPKNKGGRPPKYKTREQLQTAIDAYFEHAEAEEQPLLMLSLALHLDITEETMNQYSKMDKFSEPIKKAKLKCQDFAARNLYTGKNPTGTIFNLKCNYGWQDKQDIRITADIGEDTARMLGDLTNNSEKSWQK